MAHVARMGETRDMYKILVRISEGKKPVGKSRRNQYNIKTDLKETVCEDV